MADDFRSRGLAVIDDFADRRTCVELVDAVNDYQDRHDPLLVERLVRGRGLRYQVIDGSRVADALPTIGGLLDEIDRVVAGLWSRPLDRLDGQAGVNVNITPPGGSYRWHYDRCPVTAMLYLNAVPGGEFELYPNHRPLGDRLNGTAVQRYLDAVGASQLVRGMARRRRMVVAPAPGRLLVIRGDRCLHSVSDAGDGPGRINLVVADAESGGGRALPDLDAYLYSTAALGRRDPNSRSPWR